MLTTDILSATEICIQIASLYNGKVFGDYVINVIVPRLKYPHKQLSLTNICIWFTNHDNAKAFISDIQSLSSQPIHIIDENNYRLHLDNISQFNIQINPTFPITDFDINCLTYYYNDSGSYINAEIGIKEELISSIHKKEMTILPNYIEHLFTSVEHINKINDCYLSKGWTLKCFDIPSIKNNILLNKFFFETRDSFTSINQRISNVINNHQQLFYQGNINMDIVNQNNQLFHQYCNEFLIVTETAINHIKAFRQFYRKSHNNSFKVMFDNQTKLFNDYCQQFSTINNDFIEIYVI